MPPRVVEAQAPKEQDGKERATKEVIDAQALQETAARTVRGAQQLFGNLTGWVREASEKAQSAVADSLAGLGEDGVGPLAAVRRRTEKNQEAGNSLASKRREASRNDAAQYFVEYKGLDPALVAELQGPSGGRTDRKSVV